MNAIAIDEGAHSARRWGRPTLSAEAMILLACAWFVLACNGPFWAAVQRAQASTALAVSLGVAMFALHAFLIGLCAWGRAVRPLLAVLLVTTAFATWYMDRFAVVFDADMMRSIVQTDPAETRELLSPNLILHVLMQGALPAAALWLLTPRQLPWRRQLKRRLLFLVATLALAVGALLPVSQGVFGLMRGDPLLRYRITPGNFVVSGARALAQGDAKAALGPKRPIATDAIQVPTAATRRPRLLVLVVGETVRGDHWGLNGYARQTTPALAARADLVNFPDVSACGTSTAVSLPCMFSPRGRAHYDRAAIAGEASVLDVLANLGISVLWRDNQAGCKGVCDGVETQAMSSADDPALCHDGRCLDEILLRGLAERIQAAPGDQLIVLHMLGNHGPNYFERYPAADEHFTPTCRTAELSRCGHEEIANAYDNVLLYTDAVLDQLIELLAAERERDVAMLYVSDHGESLGEYGLYLHGAPYRVAPRAQLHVPMVLWMSPAFSANSRIDTACVREVARKPTSHDHLFPTLLGVFDVKTSAYDPERDLFAACRDSPEAVQP